jgi:hypothetical protein
MKQELTDQFVEIDQKVTSLLEEQNREVEIVAPPTAADAGTAGVDAEMAELLKKV